MREVITFCAIAETILIFLKMFILLLICLYIRIYMHMSVSTLRALNPLVTDLQVMVSHLIWVLGTELQSWKTSMPLNCGVISHHLIVFVCVRGNATVCLWKSKDSFGICFRLPSYGLEGSNCQTCATNALTCWAISPAPTFWFNLNFCMVAQSCTLFQASLVHLVSSKLACATRWDPVSNSQTKNPKNPKERTAVTLSFYREGSW